VPQGRSPLEPDLSCDLVRLVAIGRDMAHALLTGVPTPDLAWEEGFPSASLLEFMNEVTRDETLLWPFYAYVIVRQRDGLAVGDAGFRGPPGEGGRVEIGYALVPWARGEGLATAAVRLLSE
jgi:RimJ/RimL family protein N-acetyltransferase